MIFLQAIATVVMILCIVIYFLSFSSVQEETILEEKEKVTISILTLFFMLIASIHFASGFKYENSWSGRPHSILSVELNKPEQISNLIFSTAIVNDDYMVSLTDIYKRHLILCDTKTHVLDACNSGSFRIHNFDLTQFKGLPLIKSINFELESGAVEINKVLILNEKHQILTNYRLSTDSSSLIPDSIKGTSFLNDFFTSNILLSRMVADEVYYVYPAYEYLNKSFFSELYHPPLGVYFIFLGMLIFGVSAFAWRIMVYLFGVAMVPALYVFAKRVTKDKFCSIVATILIMCDFLHFIFTRVSYLDGFVTLFLVLEYYYLYKYMENRVNGFSFELSKRNLFYGAICLSLAISCKWSGLFSLITVLGAIAYVELIRYDSKNIVKIIIDCMMLFIFLPLCVYVLMFLPMVLIGHQHDLWGFFYNRQILMFENLYKMFLPSNIHSMQYFGGSSTWWRWPLNQIVMPLSGDSLQILSTNILNYVNLPDKGSVIIMITSPMISLLLPFVIVFLIYEIKVDYHKNYRAVFILLSFIAQYFIYVFVARVQYIYYFYSVIPFLILGISYVTRKLLVLDNHLIKNIVVLYVALCVISFMIYFPIISGYPVNRKFLYNFNAYLSVINALFYFLSIMIVGIILFLVKKDSSR